jgi:enoyl-CoA hydratase
VIAQAHGHCVGGGSDFALGADLVIASDDAVIGTPYSRMWGCYLSGMEIGLINQSVPFAELERQRTTADSLTGLIPITPYGEFGRATTRRF